MTTVYVQGETDLIQLQEVTADSIENALGYTPADAEDIIEGIEESDDSALYVTDKDGNIITKTDGEGFHAKAMTVNGKDVESGLVTDEDRESWGGSDLDDVISKEDDSTLYVTDKDGNIIAKIDKDGLHTTEVYIYDESVVDMIDRAVAGLDVDFEETDPTVPGWAKQPTKPTYTAEEVGALPDDGTIDTASDDVLYICDKDGNIIARFDGDGLDITDLKIGSIPFTDHIEALVEGGTPCAHEYVTIQELVRNTTDCTTWTDLQYCSSCGKVHANLLYSAHNYVDVVTPPTYQAQGYTTHKCSRCATSYIDSYVDKLIANITWTLSEGISDRDSIPTTYPTWVDNNGGSMKILIGPDGGYSLSDTITVTGCEYTWAAAEVWGGYLELKVPTSDISVTINAVTNEYAVTLSRKNSGSSWTSSTIKSGQSTILPISVNTGYWLDISETSHASSVVVYGCEYSISQSTLYPDNYTITLSNPYRDVLVAVAPKISGINATTATYPIAFHTIGCTISYTGGAVAYGGTVEIPVSAMSTNDGYTSIDYSGIKATNCTCTWNNYTGVLTLNNISGDVIVVASAT